MCFVYVQRWETQLLSSRSPRAHSGGRSLPSASHPARAAKTSQVRLWDGTECTKADPAVLREEEIQPRAHISSLPSPWEEAAWLSCWTSWDAGWGKGDPVSCLSCKARSSVPGVPAPSPPGTSRKRARKLMVSHAPAQKGHKHEPFPNRKKNISPVLLSGSSTQYLRATLKTHWKITLWVSLKRHLISSVNLKSSHM